MSSAPDDPTRLGMPEACDGDTRLAPEGAPDPTPGRGTTSSSPSKSPTGSSGWLSSSGAIDHGRFDPGTLQRAQEA